jgi:hypothetical protein
MANPFEFLLLMYLQAELALDSLPVGADGRPGQMLFGFSCYFFRKSTVAAHSV